MKHLEAIEIFQRVAELSSFTAAAESLGLPKSSASTAIRQLEGFVGTRLFHRTTRRVQLTPDGETFYTRSRGLLDEMDALQHMFREDHSELQGRLRVDMPLGTSREIVMPRLGEFLETHPRIDIELSSSDRRVDLVKEGFDCVVRVGTLEDSTLISRPLGHYRIINCISRRYADQYGIPVRLDDLAEHRLIHYVQSSGGRSPGFEYASPDEPGQTLSIAMPGALTVHNSEAYLGACRAGLGLIQVPDHAMRPLLESGELLNVLPAFQCPPMPVSLLYASREHLPRRVRVFMDWLAGLMSPGLI